MIKIEHLKVYNLDGAIRGMRNPKNSWLKSDSEWVVMDNFDREFVIGNNDMKLMQMLYKGGPVHRKFLRQVFVSADITSNHTFWAEADTYKVGTVRDSCSKMHKIHAKSFEKKDFSHEGIDLVGGETLVTFNNVITTLEMLRQKFNETGDKKYWRAMIDLLPMGYNIKATWSFNYETVMNILDWRSNHKMFEWRELCKELRELPYVKQIRGEK